MLTRAEKERVSEIYYARDGQKIRREAIKALNHIRCTEDIEEFVDLANYIFVHDVLETFDKELGDDLDAFNGYLFTCLTRKFMTEMTRLNRQKRQADRLSFSLEAKDDDGCSVLDFVESKFDLERKTIGNTTEQANKCDIYMESLSSCQKKIINLLLEGFDKKSIVKKLQITSKDYDKHMKIMKSSNKVSILYL